LQSPGDALSYLSLDRPLKSYLDLAPYVEVLVDSSARLGWPEAQQAEGYQPYEKVAAEFPLPLGCRLWARFRVAHTAEFEQKLLLYTGETDSLVCYHLQGDSIATARTGYRVLPAERDILRGRPVGITLSLAPRDTSTVYFLVQEVVYDGPHPEPRLYDYTTWQLDFMESEARYTSLYILFLGTALILILYNLIIFFSTRIRTYLYYALYLVALLLAMSFDGLARDWPNLAFPDPRYNYLMSAIGICSITICYLLFGRSLVETKTLTPRWDKALRVIIGFRIVYLVVTIYAVAFADAYEEVWNTLVGINLLMIVIEGLILLVYMYWLIRSGSQVVWFFIVGSILVFGSGLSPILLNAVFNWELDTFGLLLGSLFLEILVFSLGLGYKMRKQQREKLDVEQALNRELSKVNSAFGRFVPHEFISSLGYESVLDVKLGDQVEKEVTVLFSDIRGYTTLSEQMTPAENFQFLNAYLGRLGPVIQQHGGFVNQYYGDGIMALFLNAPTDALQAAVGMLQALETYNHLRQAKGREPIRMGIGLHTGPLMMGIIGDTLRLEAGVVSDTVNTAARMEGLTKHYGVNLLLSEATQRGLGPEGGIGLRSLGYVLVKGRKQPLGVYECYDGDVAAQRAKKAEVAPAFEAAFAAYLAGDFAAALQGWTSILRRLPGDPPTQHYLALTQHYLSEGTPDGWDGVEVMMMK
jgi:adenylate cyclase